MKTELTYADITEKLCRHCAYCCHVYVPVELDERTREYYMEVGLDVECDPESPNVGILNAGACQHLMKKESSYGCRIYGTRPQLCKDYNCIAWAKVSGVDSDAVAHALGVYNSIYPP